MLVRLPRPWDYVRITYAVRKATIDPDSRTYIWSKKKHTSANFGSKFCPDSVSFLRPRPQLFGVLVVRDDIDDAQG